ncbi:MAG: class I SAM-dependent methyltransferase [Desulfobacterales bacterium]
MKAQNAFLYDDIGTAYSRYRLPDGRIAAVISREVADARFIVNIGAGVGAYEPRGKAIVAVEPSRVMTSQRKTHGNAVIQARAEALPFREDTFDCALAVLTIHHWGNMENGLREAMRVTKGSLVLLTWIGFVSPFWLLDYLPQIKRTDEPLFPSLDRLSSWLGPLRSIPVPIPHDCTDGFLCAYWRRPEAYLDAGVRSAISTFARVRDTGAGLDRLSRDLSTGAWHRKYGNLLQKHEMDFGYRLVVAAPHLHEPTEHEEKNGGCESSLRTPR